TLASRTHVLLTHEWVVFLGKISYGLYVFHYLGINRAARLLALPLLGGIENKWARLGLVAGVGLTLTTIAAVLSWYLLESPFLRLKRRFARPAPRPDCPRSRGESPRRLREDALCRDSAGAARTPYPPPRVPATPTSGSTSMAQSS